MMRAVEGFAPERCVQVCRSELLHPVRLVSRYYSFRELTVRDCRAVQG